MSEGGREFSWVLLVFFPLIHFSFLVYSPFTSLPPSPLSFFLFIVFIFLIQFSLYTFHLLFSLSAFFPSFYLLSFSPLFPFIVILFIFLLPFSLSISFPLLFFYLSPLSPSFIHFPSSHSLYSSPFSPSLLRSLLPPPFTWTGHLEAHPVRPIRPPPICPLSPSFPFPSSPSYVDDGIRSLIWAEGTEDKGKMKGTEGKVRGKEDEGRRWDSEGGRGGRSI